MSLLEDEAGPLPRPFGRYTLLGVLGEGGMGRVYRAELRGPSGFRKSVALKVIRGLLDEPSARELFEQEARVGGLLHHPNIVDVYDFGFEAGTPFLVMEWVQGAGLDSVLRQGGLLAPARALEIAVGIARGLAHAHGLCDEGGRPIEVVHRDLKPGNVLIGTDGSIKITDFGLARATAGQGASAWSGVVRGTPAYMSPEQARGEPLDGRSDLFALGAIVYELVTGRRFFHGDSLVAVMMRIVTVDQHLGMLEEVDGRVPGLSAILRRCLAGDRGLRFGRASELAEALSERWFALPTRGATAPPQTQSDAGPPSSGPPSRAQDTFAETLPTRGPMGAPTASRGVGRVTNLAVDGGALLGRTAELAALDGLAGSPIVTLLGPGGTGKTRLARVWAMAQLPRYQGAGGVWFVDLAQAHTASDVLDQVSRVLELGQDGAEAERRTRVGAALVGRGATLLVLDNVEQVLAAVTDLLSPWVDGAAGASFLVTSRERLRLAAEQVVEVEPLDAAAGLALFVERAAAARPGWRLAEAETEVADEIVRRLDGIPLAIELAAARVAVLPLRGILERLAQRFQLLAGGRRGALQRQATLRATLEWSWMLLDEAEQDALAQLSVFHGGFEVEAAEATLDLSAHPAAPWVLDVLQALRDKSLVRVAATDRDRLRFALLESVREYAAEHLRQVGPARARHARWYADAADVEAARLEGPAGGEALRAVEREVANIRAALSWAASEEPLLALRLGAALDGLHARLGPPEARAAVVALCLPLAAGAGADAGAQWAVANAAVARVEGRLGDARVALQAVVEDEGVPAATRARAAMQLSEMAHYAGDHAAGEGYSERSLRWAQGAGDPVLFVRALAARANSGWSRGDGGAGVVALHEDAWSRAKALGLGALAADLENRLGILAMDAGRVDEGLRRFRAAAAGFRSVGATLDEAKVHANLGLVLIREGAFDDARQSLERAARKLTWIGDRRISGGILTFRGALFALLREDEVAGPLFDAAVAEGDRSGALHLQGMGHVARGYFRLGAGLPGASDDFTRGLAAFRRNPAAAAHASALAGLAAAQAMSGDGAAAQRTFDEAEVACAADIVGNERALLGAARGWFALAERDRAHERGDAEAETHAADLAVAHAEATWRLPRQQRQAITLLCADGLFRRLGLHPPPPSTHPSESP